MSNALLMASTKSLKINKAKELKEKSSGMQLKQFTFDQSSMDGLIKDSLRSSSFSIPVRQHASVEKVRKSNDLYVSVRRTLVLIILLRAIVSCNFVQFLHWSG